MDEIKPSRLIATSCQINENISTETKPSTCILQMTIEDPAIDDKKVPKQRTINMELSSSTLKTMVEDFSRIRDQLTNVARK